MFLVTSTDVSLAPASLAAPGARNRVKNVGRLQLFNFQLLAPSGVTRRYSVKSPFASATVQTMGLL
jgi:hypothetical protein